MAAASRRAAARGRRRGHCLTPRGRGIPVDLAEWSAVPVQAQALFVHRHAPWPPGWNAYTEFRYPA